MSSIAKALHQVNVLAEAGFGIARCGSDTLVRRFCLCSLIGKIKSVGQECPTHTTLYQWLNHGVSLFRRLRFWLARQCRPR